MKISNAVACACVCLLLGACGGKADRIDSHLKQGQEYARQAEWDKASVEVRNVLQMDPKRASAYYLAAQVEEGRRDMQRAYGYYLKAVELKPDYIDAKAGLARIYMLAGETEKSEQMVAEVLKAEPGQVSVRTLKAALLARRGDASGAIDEATRIIASEKSIPAEPSLLLAGLYASQGDERKALQVIEAALQSDRKNVSLLAVAAQLSGAQANDAVAAQRAVGYYRAATEAAPRNAELWNVWALYHSRRNEIDLAEGVLRDAVRAQPDEVQRTLTLLDFLANRRRFDLAEKEFLATIAAHPKEAQFRFALVNLYQNAGRPEDAQRVLNEIVALAKDAPSTLAAKNQLAAYRLTANRVAEAKILLDEVLKASPRNNTALVLRGRIRLSEGLAREAVIDLRAAAKDQPASPEIAGLLAEAHRVAQEPQLAREVLADAVKFKPDSADLRLLLAVDMAGAGDVQGAQDQVELVLKTAPKTVHAYELKAQLAVSRKDSAEAEKALLALKTEFPKEPIGSLRLGQLYAEQKKVEAALKQYDEAASLAPEAAEPLLAAVGLLIAQRKFDAARARIAGSIQRNPKNVLAYQLEGELGMAQGDFARAQQAYEKVVELAPTVSAGYLKLAQVMASRSDMPGAFGALERGEKNNPGDLALPTARAEWLSRAGRSDDAIAAYEALLTRAPDNEAYANNLAYLLTETKGDKKSLERALQLVGRFGSSSNPGYLDSLGWVRYRLGQYAESVPPLERAIERLPNAPLMQLHLGMALYKKGDTERAKEMLRKAVQAPGQSTDLLEARKILGQG